MSKGHIALQPAYVLHRKPYRETSLLIEAFTRDYGRVGLVARGARRGKGRLTGLLQPFRPLLLSWSGRGELLTLTGAESMQLPPSLSGRLLLSGFYLNELLLRLLQRDDPHADLFKHYARALSGLVQNESWTLRCFEKELLQALGYGLSLREEVESGAAVQAEGLYQYHLERGAVRCDHVPSGALSIHGRSLLALAGDYAPDEQALHECKMILRAALGVHLGLRPLASRALYRRSLSKGTILPQQKEG